VEFKEHVLVAAALALGSFVHVAAAAEEEPEVGLNGAVNFGFAEARGNTDTLSITGDTTVQYVTGGPWVHDGRFLFVTRQESGATTEERYEARGTANYYWTEDDYFFGRVDWRKDNFGGVREEWVPSVGYGRVLIRSERHDLRGEVGAGYRSADLSDGTSEEGALVSGGLRYRWQISDTAEFFQNALVQSSSDNTYVESETGLRTLIVGALSARISYLVRHNTDVPDGTRNSDFFTNIGLEYKF
jgi:putative salt-induced outer membrane protein